LQPDVPLARRHGMTRTFLLVAAAAVLAGAPVPAPAPPPALAARQAPAPVATPSPLATTSPIVAPGPVATPSPSAVPAPVLSGPPPTRGRPWFATPQQAMRYLTRAYNTHDANALAKVTTPDARSALVAMRGYAPSLTLTGCTRLAAGDYDCEFTHTLAKPSAGHRHGHAKFRVAPAIRHGWYMTVLEDCGDGE
jgi:hypothetical protein